MKVSSERIEGCRATLNIEVEPEEMEKAMDGAYRRLVNRVVIPGFRKGKAPRHMLERHIGTEYMVSEALERLVPELYDKAIEQEEIDAIDQPEVEMAQLEPPIIKATVPLRPVVELGDYRTIKVTPNIVDITDEAIDNAVENLRHANASWEPVEREARFGDLVTINVKGVVEQETVLDNEGVEYHLTADSTMPVPGFAEHIVGMQLGEENEFRISFPEDWPTAEYAGKECTFKVSTSAVKEEKLPELDDTLAKSIGQEIETVEQLREKISGNLRVVAEREAKNKMESDVIEAAVEQSTIEFPAILTEREIDRMVNEQLMRLGGMTFEDYLKYRGITEEEFRDQLREGAGKRVANSLFLMKVREEENIEIDENEINAEIDRMVQNAGEQGEQIQQMLDSPQARESIRNDLLTHKTLEHLIKIATGEPLEPELVNSVPSDAEEEKEVNR